MKLLPILLIVFFLSNCSFDNKSGIWKNENQYEVSENKDVFKEFQTLSASNNLFNEIVAIDKNYQFKLKPLEESSSWNEKFYSLSNNYKNFKYTNLNQLIFRGKKLTKYKLNNHLLFDGENIFASDTQGNLIVFSIEENKIMQKFNFYKKKYKKNKKKLNLILEKDIIYVTDNFGYFYAYNFKLKKLIWAKNYKIPFRSNIKLLKNKIITSDLNNNLYFLNKRNGEVFKLIPTEENKVKNEFINNISLTSESILFLNTYGTLYSIDNRSLRINWFLSLNKSVDINPNNLFKGSIVINDDNYIVVSSNKNLFIFDSKSGNLVHKKNFSAFLNPQISNNHLFLVTKNNLLISVDLISGKLIYSYDINEKISEYLKIKKKNVILKDLLILNNQIHIFLKNSFVLKFNVKGNLEEINKLPSKINSLPIIVESSILYSDTKNRISVVN